MDPEFWLQRWERGEIGFHQSEVNRNLVEHWGALAVDAAAPVFVPLCGKSRDMCWLRERGHSIVGVELSETAVRDFFAETELSPAEHEAGPFTAYEASGFELLCGDLFALSSENLKNVRAVYDRAALVALPPDLRREYARALAERLPSRVAMLLVTFEYDQARASGPPFSVDEPEVRALYEPAFHVELLDRKNPVDVPARFKDRGLSSFAEAVYAVRRD